MEVEGFARLEGKFILLAGVGLVTGAEFGVNGFIEVTAVVAKEIAEAPIQKAVTVVAQKTKKEVQNEDVDQLSLEI